MSLSAARPPFRENTVNVTRAGAVAAAALLTLGLSGCAAYHRYADMTFFVTSTGNGKGANFGGLEGADQHCQALAKAANHQDWTAEGAVILAVTAVETRTTRKYGERGVRYVHMEAGHAAQGALLQAAALGLGGTVVGAFDDAAVAKVLDLRKGEQPLYLVPLGRPR